MTLSGWAALRPYQPPCPAHSAPGPTSESSFPDIGMLSNNSCISKSSANDWQAALVPAYLAWKAVKIPTILTIHNLAYQGLFPKESLRRIGAPEDSFHIDGLEFYDKLSFLKGGIIYASHLTTVSETYAKE